MKIIYLAIFHKEDETYSALADVELLIINKEETHDRDIEELKELFDHSTARLTEKYLSKQI